MVNYARFPGFTKFDGNGLPDNNAAGFRVESARLLLKSLVDAALDKYRQETDAAATAAGLG